MLATYLTIIFSGLVAIFVLGLITSSYFRDYDKEIKTGKIHYKNPFKNPLK